MNLYETLLVAAATILIYRTFFDSKKVEVKKGVLTEIDASKVNVSIAERFVGKYMDLDIPESVCITNSKNVGRLYTYFGVDNFYRLENLKYTDHHKIYNLGEDGTIIIAPGIVYKDMSIENKTAPV
jgi:hypothetical protein